MQHHLNIHGALLRIDGAKEDIHVLERLALGLLDEEEDPHAHGYAEDAEHYERAPADGVHGIGRDFRDAKVK